MVGRSYFAKGPADFEGNDWERLNPVHFLTEAVEHWIDAEAFLHQFAPTKTTWAGSALLAEQEEYAGFEFALCAGSKKTEIAYRVAISIWNVRGQEAHKSIK